MLNITNHHRNANQCHNEISSYTCWMAIIKKIRDSKCWWECGEKETLVHCWQECKLVRPLWKTVWRFLKKLKSRTELPYNPAISLLGTYIWRKWKHCLKEIPAFSCSMQHYSQQPRHGSNLSSIIRWMKKMWCVYTHTPPTGSIIQP